MSYHASQQHRTNITPLQYNWLSSIESLTVSATDTLEQPAAVIASLEAARAGNPDLVISDILMPSMDGFEFVRRLRADPQLHNVSVIFYTAHYHEAEARNLAQACRVSRVIVKAGGAAGIVRAVSEV